MFSLERRLKYKNESGVKVEIFHPKPKLDMVKVNNYYVMQHRPKCTWNRSLTLALAQLVVVVIVVVVFAVVGLVVVVGGCVVIIFGHWNLIPLKEEVIDQSTPANNSLLTEVLWQINPYLPEYFGW